MITFTATCDCCLGSGRCYTCEDIWSSVLVDSRRVSFPVKSTCAFCGGTGRCPTP